jgi:hypothetical protein
MTGGEAGGIDSVIDASFYSQGFLGLKDSRQSISFMHLDFSLQAFMILGWSWSSKADRQWARAPFAFCRSWDFQRLFILCRPGSRADHRDACCQ